MSDEIEIWTRWDGIKGYACAPGWHEGEVDGNSVAHAVSKLVWRLAADDTLHGRRWRADGATGVVSPGRRRKAADPKPSRLPQLPSLDGRMNGHRRMKRA